MFKLLEHRIIEFGGNKIILGDKNAQETTFKSVAHAFPQSMGNRQLRTYYECDECNYFFSMSIENCFGKYFIPLNNTMLIQKEKGGTPTIKSEIVRQESNPKTREVIINVDVNSDNSVLQDGKIVIPGTGIEIDLAKNIVNFEYKKQPYIPIAVFKCFVKMAVSIMEPEIADNFRETINWIRSPKHEDFYSNGRKLILTRAWMRSAIPDGSIYYWLCEGNDSDVLPPRTFFYVAWGQLWCMIEIPIKMRSDDFEVNNTPILTLLAEKTNKNKIHFFDFSNKAKIYRDSEYMSSSIIGKLKRTTPEEVASTAGSQTF